MNDPIFSIFDLDGTTTYSNSSFAFFLHLVRKKLLPRVCLARALYFWFLFTFGGMSLREFHRRVFSVFVKGRRREFFEGEVEAFLDEWLEGEVDWDLLRGRSGALLSSSPDFLVGPIARRLGIEQWLGTEYSVDKDGRFCEISKIVGGEEKLAWARRRVKGPVCAYSDSHHDLPLLEWADFVCVVRPSRKLRKIARERGWSVKDQ